ncbi:MAG: hypothetical protein AB1414_03195 [bacterium]
MKILFLSPLLLTAKKTSAKCPETVIVRIKTTKQFLYLQGIEIASLSFAMTNHPILHNPLLLKSEKGNKGDEETNNRNRSGCNEGEMEKLGKRGKSILILVRKSYYLECH